MRWTPWSVLQDGTIGAKQLVGDLLTSPRGKRLDIRYAPDRLRGELRWVPSERKRGAAPFRESPP